MNAVSDPQRRAFEFLLKKFQSQELFTKQAFRSATGWAEGTFNTYCSKQFNELLVRVGDSYRVHGIFGQFSNWAKFRERVVTQKRKLVRAYTSSIFESVVVFEFFMPLRNEEYLRGALDSLFFKDSVITRLRVMETTHQKHVHDHFPIRDDEPKNLYFERMSGWVADKFVGYSIHHVSGRFRLGALRTREESLKQEVQIGERYLVDETTAVVRFIIPCDKTIVEEANRIRWFFTELFVQRIIEAVAGEDEIWLLESGLHNRLHIWRAVG
jgi:hypothetical protein